jgi:nitric oxide reductase NorQ protein
MRAGHALCLCFAEYPDPAPAQAVSARYLAVGREVDTFRAAALAGLPVLLKGPTGSGKTRLVEHMAELLRRPLFTVACHEDLSAADLVGRYLLKGGETQWEEGPLTRAVRQGGICYIDEIVEARADTTVVIHPLADHRRELHLERLGEVLRAPPEFMLVVSYNPGYQSVLKDLKESTRQRMVAIELAYPPAEIEQRVLIEETGIDPQTAQDLVKLAAAIRQLDTPGLPEVASTRSLVSTARLARAQLPLREAARSAIARALSDDPEIVRGLCVMIDTYLPA